MISRTRPRNLIVSKQRVRLRYDHDRVGTVHRAGPEQSEIKWDDGWPQNIYANQDLEVIETKAKAK